MDDINGEDVLELLIGGPLLNQGSLHADADHDGIVNTVRIPNTVELTTILIDSLHAVARRKTSPFGSVRTGGTMAYRALYDMGETIVYELDKDELISIKGLCEELINECEAEEREAEEEHRDYVEQIGRDYANAKGFK